MAAAKLQDQVNTWVELNQQRTNRWHALRLALRSCIKRPIIGDTIAAIKAGEQGDSAAVRLFVNTFSTHTESRRLLDDLVVETIEQFRNLSLQAMSVDIISEGEHLANIYQVHEWMEELSDRRSYVDVSDIDDDVQLRVRSMEKILNSSAAQLEEELDRELLSIRTKVGQDAVPEGWDVRARQALEKRNLSLVRELINQLKEHSERNARLVETSLLDNAELTAFLQVNNDLYTLLHEHPNSREAGERVINEQPGGLDYAAHKADFKETIGTLLEWRSKGKNKRPALEKPTYEDIVGVLQFLGIDPVNKLGTPDVLSSCEYTP